MGMQATEEILITEAPRSAAVRTAFAMVLDITEAGVGRIRHRAELGAGLADADQTDTRGDPAETICMMGIRCGGDNPGHGGPMSVAILGAVTGEHIVPAGRRVRVVVSAAQPRCR